MGKTWFLVFMALFCACTERGPRIQDASRMRPVRPARVRPRVDASLPVIAGFHATWEDEVVREYRPMFRRGSRRAWAEAVNRCVESDGNGGRRFIAPIREAARIMRGRYPEAFIAGIIVHESWCLPNVVTRDGGTGYVQITVPRGAADVDERWRARARLFLGHEPDWRHDPVENIVLGLSQLMESELELGSRELGLAAYNAGIGGVRNAMRRAGWRPGQAPPDINDVARYLPHRPHRWDARWYAAQVMAKTVYANRVKFGCRHIEVIDRNVFDLTHVPGARP